MKKLLLYLLTLSLLSMPLMGAGQQEEKIITVGLVISTLNNPFFVTMKEGAEKKAAELGYNMIVLDSQNDPDKELKNMEDLLTQEADAILINPTDSDAVSHAINMANKQAVPVITLDRTASIGEVATHIASDNVAGGIMAGEYVIELLGGSGTVVELEGIPGTSASRDRGMGFNMALVGSGVKVVARQTADFDRTKGLNVMEEILQAQSDIDAVFAHNDEMALGAQKAIARSGRDIKIIGFDAVDDAVAAVKSGEIHATIAQQPAMIGSRAVEAAARLITGETIETYMPVNLMLVK